MRDDPKRRQVHRLYGSLKFIEDGRLVPGPFTVETQMEMLGRLKHLEAETGMRLVGDYEGKPHPAHLGGRRAREPRPREGQGQPVTSRKPFTSVFSGTVGGELYIVRPVGSTSTLAPG